MTPFGRLQKMIDKGIYDRCYFCGDYIDELGGEIEFDPRHHPFCEYCWEFVHRPINMSLDGDKWCALWGENLQEGLAGFGDTVLQALQALLEDVIDHMGRWKKPMPFAVKKGRDSDE